MNPADEISQKEKREVLRNDRLSTYHAHAQTSIDDDRGGRFSVQTKPTVIGRSPISYPQQPQGSPWACDPVGLEPPLGFDVNALEPVGEAHEVRASEATEKHEQIADPSPEAEDRHLSSIPADGVPSTTQAVEPTVAPARVDAGHAFFRLKRRRC